MVTIANPIYDTVFKFLMEDDKSAKILIGALLEVEVVELEMRQNEHAFKIKNDLEILRIDFAAKIKDKEGKLRVVTIELQKAKMESDVLRFRKYLAAQYRNKSNIEVNDDGHKAAIPIVSIFIMGYPCCDVAEPIIYGIPEFYNAEKKKIEKLESDFVFGLIHRMIIVQVPYLRKKILAPVERILSVFDQTYKIDKQAKNAHFLKVCETMDDNPDYSYIVRQLVKASVNDKIQDEMDVEDDIYDEIEMWGQLLEIQAKQLDEQTKQLDEQNKLLAEKDSKIAEKDRKMAKKLFASGDSIEEIADFLNISIDLVKAYLQ